MYAGKVESVIFDRNKSVFQICKTSVICRQTTKSFRLSDIAQVKGIKKGHSGVNVYTMHYKIIVEFQNMPPVKILETQNRTKVIKQVRILCLMLIYSCV